MTKTGPKPLDIANKTFDRLTAVSYVGKGFWRFVCECGNSKNLWATDVRRGKVRSCGCLAHEVKSTGDLRRVHGKSGTPEYSSWNAMVNRCTNPNAAGFRHYGGRGITIHGPWLADFMNFFVDMGPRPKGTTLDRKDPNGDYGPDNCRWADAETQGSNQRRIIPITANGKTQTIEAWARELGCSRGVLRYRRRQGWPDDAIINTPIHKPKRW
jgi:hypothetical protein